MIRVFWHRHLRGRALPVALLSLAAGLVAGHFSLFPQRGLPATSVAAVLCVAGILAALRPGGGNTNNSSRHWRTQADSRIRIEGLLTAIEQASESVVVTDRDGTIEYVNPAFTAITGYTLEEAVGNNPRLLKSGRHSPEFYAELWQTIQSGRIWRGEVVNRRKDGTFYTEQMSISPMLEAGGAITGFIAVKQDNTERYAAQRDRGLLAAILSCSQTAIVTHSPDGNVQTWDRGAEMLFGYSTAEMAGKSFSTVIARDSRDQLLEHTERAIRGIGEPLIEVTGVSKHQRRFAVAITTSIIRDDAGEIVSLSEIVRDVSHIKKAEQSQMLLASIVESSDAGIIATTLDGTIVSWNRGAELLYGYTSAEALGKPLTMLIPPGEETAIFETLERIKAGTPVVHLETFARIRDGRKVSVSVAASAIRDSRGHIVGAAGITRDITERKQAELDLRRALESAEIANRAKSEFLANMSHEIRTPMNGIIGMVELMLRTDLNTAQRRYAEVVRDCSNSLLAVLNDILDFSKIEARKMTLENEDFDLRAVVEGTVDLFAVKTQQKRIELRTFIEPQAPTSLRGDPARLRQVLTNLVGNAVKFTDSGEISVRVRLEAEGDPATLRIEVSDTGAGVPARKQHLLFQPFSQADSSSSRKFSGTGLGLSIVKELVELMDGEVGFTSEEGRGSCFWFKAPFALQKTGRPATLSLRGRRVLGVVKNAATRIVLEELLALWQCDFRLVPEINDGLAEMESAPPGQQWETVIVDLDCTEIEARVIIEQARRLQHCPMLLLVPSSWGIDQPRWSSLGAAAAVSKPVKQGELGNRLATALGLGPVPNAANSASAGSAAPAERSRRSRYRILAVDDNPMNQEVAAGLLQHLGYGNVDLAANGREAIEALSARDYDAVLMDCQLPELDGYEATRVIRDPSSGVRNHSVAVIALTAHALAEDRARCLAAGMDDYISKPIHPEVLERVLDFWTGRGAPVSAPVPEPAAAPAQPEQVFDRDGFLDRVMNNMPLAHRVATVFLRDVPSQLAALSQALSEADAGRIRLTAHSLKGSAGAVGGTSVRETASAIERMGSAGDLQGARTLLPDLVAQTGKLQTEVEEFCKVPQG